MEETKRHVLEVVAKRTKREITDGDSFESLDLDSLDKLDIVTELMDDFNIDIDPRELDEIESIKDFVSLVIKKKDEALQLSVFGSRRNGD